MLYQEEQPNFLQQSTGSEILNVMMMMMMKLPTT
jgi:hypothetical protein